DPRHGNQVAGERTAVSQRVVRGDPGTEQWGCLDVAQTGWYRGQGLDRSNHVLLITSVVADAANLHVLAITKIATAALPARVVVATVPANANTLSFLPRGNALPDPINDARHLMSGHAGILNARPRALYREHVAVAHTTGLHPDEHLSWTRLGNFALHDFKARSRFRYLRYLHWRQLRFRRYSQCCHKSSSNIRRSEERR